MKEYFLYTIDRALSGDGAAILKCIVFAFVIHFLYSKILELFAEIRLKRVNFKDVTKAPSRTKLMERGYNQGINIPTQANGIKRNT